MMAGRKDVSHQRGPAGGTGAQSQPQISKDYCTATKPSNGSKNTQLPLEEERDRKIRGSTEPYYSHSLAEENESKKRTQRRTVRDFANTGRDRSPEEDLVHTAFRRDVVHTTVNAIHSAVTYGTLRDFGEPHGTAISSSPPFSKHTDYSNQKNPSSLLPITCGTQRERRTPHDTISPSEVELDTKREQSTTHDTASPIEVKFSTEREHRTPHDTANLSEGITRLGTLNPQSADTRIKRKHTTSNAKCQKSEKFVRPKRRATIPGSIMQESEVIGSQRRHAITCMRGPICQVSEEFGPKRNHHTTHDTSRLGTMGEHDRNNTNLHVNSVPALTEFDTHENHACTRSKASRITSNETEVNSTNFNPIANESAEVSLGVPEQGDDSSVKKTGGQQQDVEEKWGSSNSSADDKEFFTCPICSADKLRCWLLLPCGHLLCFNCKQRMSICPFCRTPVQQYKKISYSWDNNYGKQPD